MLFKYLYKLLFFLTFALPLTITAQVIDIGPLKNHCASPEEMKLYKLISDYRRIHKLAPLPLSRSLSYVARIHAMDISFNRPDFGGCNPHSWSAKGNWKACCYARDNNRLKCMNEKPKEITGYKYKGWEMVYSGGEEARAEDAFDLWKGLGLTNDYLLNTGKWANPWRAIGIGFYGEYASVWFGEGDDTEKDYGLCVTDSTALKSAGDIAVEQNSLVLLEETESGSVVKYFVITGSLNNQEKAYNEVQRLRDLGYSKARVIASGENFRISIADYPTEKEAQEALPAFAKLFPGAWVFKLAE